MEKHQGSLGEEASVTYEGVRPDRTPEGKNVLKAGEELPQGMRLAPGEEPPLPEKAFDAKAFLKTVPNRPGSYRMYDVRGEVIYVGKAKDLKKRLSSYFLKNVTAPKTRALVAHIQHIEFTVTFSETEALILENNLIKEYQPRYNILLRDDKSYPYLLLTKQKHPGLYYHRGAKRREGEYFGPYPDSGAVKESLRLLQKLFPIRQCTDTVYAHRSRPCLMAQLGKCLAPCVPLTEAEEEEYARQVSLVRLFLKGQNQELLNTLTERMQSLSAELKFEAAAKVRDQLLALRRVQESQSVSADGSFDLDAVGTALEAECDDLVVVTAPYETSVERIARRDGISAEMARRRLDAQTPEDVLTARASFQLENTGPLETLRQAAGRVLDQLLDRAAGQKGGSGRSI